MSSRTHNLDAPLWEYMLETGLREPELFRRLRAQTATLPQAQMQISPEQGQFMMLLVELLGCRRAIEIGTFTGYSALCVAAALPDDGRLIACEFNREWTALAQRYWKEAGVAHKIDLRLAPALETLDELIAAGQAGAFDFIFIDADKANYGHYYDRALVLLRPGGLLAVDNAFWSGRVADPSVNDADTLAIRSLTRAARDDQRVTVSLVPIGDGLLLARKRR
jgi:caffeoyl-CoA O-methyltransferase